MSSLSTSESVILRMDAPLPPHYCEDSTHPGEDTFLPESDRPSLLLSALGNESLIFEDEEREFLESPIITTFPIPITPTPQHGFAYECTSNASFCSIDEDPSASLNAPPPPPHPHEVDFTPDPCGVIVPGHALFVDFPGVRLHVPQEGDVDQPTRPFVDEDTCFIRELPDPELLAPPATTFSGEVLSVDDYIIVPEGYTIEHGGGSTTEVERDNAIMREELDRNTVQEPCPLPRSISNKENTFITPRLPLRTADDAEPGLCEALSRLECSSSTTSQWSIIGEAQDAQDTCQFSIPEPHPIALLHSKIIAQEAQDTCPLSPSESIDADIGYTGLVPSLVLHIAETEDWDAQDHCLPPIASYDHELLYAPPMANNGRMEDVWEAYHYPFQALMEEAQRQESSVQDFWNEITETVAKAWRAGGLGRMEQVVEVDEAAEIEDSVGENWKVGRRNESEGKEVVMWQEKDLTSWFARKVETGKRRWRSF